MPSITDKNFLRRFALALSCAVLAATSQATGAASWNIAEVGPAGSWSATKISTILGLHIRHVYASLSGGYVRCVIEKNEGPHAPGMSFSRDLGTLGGVSCYPSAINQNGEITGSSTLPAGPNVLHAFLYREGEMIDLGTFGGNISVGYGIDDKGRVVGTSQTESGAEHAFYYSQGKMQDLGTLGGKYSGAYDMNNRGQIVGYSTTVEGKFHAVLYQNGNMLDLNTLPEVQAAGWELNIANTINESGVIRGNGLFKGQLRAFELSPITP